MLQVWQDPHRDRYRVVIPLQNRAGNSSRIRQEVIWGEPERAPHWSKRLPRDLSMYVCIYTYVIP